MATQIKPVNSGITPPASTAAPSTIVSREQSASIPNDPHSGGGRMAHSQADPGSSGRDRMNSLADPPSEAQNPAESPPRISGGRRDVMGLGGGGRGPANPAPSGGADGPAPAVQQTPSKSDPSRAGPSSSGAGDGKSGGGGKDPLASPGSPSEPETISYSAERIIGNGSFGVVFQASVVETGEIVAIKKVLQDKRFKNRELQIMRQLVRDGHSNIVALKHCFYSQVRYLRQRAHRREGRAMDVCARARELRLTAA